MNVSFIVELVYESGNRFTINQLPYKEWIKYAKWEGASDIAYADWLRKNNLHDIRDFDMTHDDCWIETKVITEDDPDGVDIEICL